MRLPKTVLRMAALWAILLGAGAAPAATSGNDPVVPWLAVSTTQMPFARAVADRVGRRDPGLREPVPILRDVATAEGFERLCSGAPTLAAVIATRRMTAREYDRCRAAEVIDVVELTVGLSALGLVHGAALPIDGLTSRSLYLAIARMVPRDGKLVPNPYTSWHEIDPALPAIPIAVALPSPREARRAQFDDAIMEAGCRPLPEIRSVYGADKRRQLCIQARTDGMVQEADDPAELIRRIAAPGSTVLTILSLADLRSGAEEGAPAVNAPISIDGIPPVPDRFLDGRYPLTMATRLYLTRRALDQAGGLRDYVAEFLREAAIGPGGYLEPLGLVPLPTDDRRLARRNAANLRLFAP
ncbi:ABC-type phosphate transport system (plasmid) [Azospirillum sp. B510]|uniref:PstS family phosphate ABC transporter substrate-binding protein n=1 Tax=Azospirillum sp. (strain B510) TaxID=137722 RepID=UPI0001C4CE41|nr:substrate-binding domain-containing protein [Azospirillum sp. B510]BAI76555.1 ABC-type phosphate transport system [Azospirillum sp. B510]